MSASSAAATATLAKTVTKAATVKATECVGNACIGNYIVPGALTGLLVFIMLMLVAVVALY